MSGRRRAPAIAWSGPVDVGRWVRSVGLVAFAAMVLASCASADESSFTSLPAADAQARAWVDAAVTSAAMELVPDAEIGEGHSEGPDSCTTSPDFAEMSYSLSVDVPPEQVDAVTAAIYLHLRDEGFGEVVTDGPSGTAPVPPGPGSPSWSLFLAHDNFTVELIGARTGQTYVSTYIVTPCLATG